MPVCFEDIFSSATRFHTQLSERLDSGFAQYSPKLRQATSTAEGIVQQLREDATPQIFVFDDQPDDAHCDFGGELVQNGLFHIPYDTCIYLHPVDSIDVDGEFVTRQQCLLIREHDAKGSVHWDALSLLAFSKAERAQYGVAYDGHNVISITASSSSAARPSVWGFNAQESNFSDIPHLAQVTSEQVNFTAEIIMGLSAAMMSREVRQTQIPEPSKLNKARRKRGKPLYSAHNVVHLHVANSGYPDQSDGTSSVSESTSRRSPRTHWRRGHLRRLPNKEKLIPIPPVLVNANDEPVEYREYQVRMKPLGKS